MNFYVIIPVSLVLFAIYIRIRCWHEIKEFIKNLNLFGRIRKIENILGQHGRDISCILIRNRLWEWSLSNPSKYRVGQKIKFKNSVYSICKIDITYAVYGLSHYYCYEIAHIDKNKKIIHKTVTEHELYESNQPKKRTTNSRSKTTNRKVKKR